MTTSSRDSLLDRMTFGSEGNDTLFSRSKTKRFDEAELEEQKREEVIEARRALMSLPYDVSSMVIVLYITL